MPHCFFQALPRHLGLRIALGHTLMTSVLHDCWAIGTVEQKLNSCSSPVLSRRQYRQGLSLNPCCYGWYHVILSTLKLVFWPYCYYHWKAVWEAHCSNRNLHPVFILHLFTSHLYPYIHVPTLSFRLISSFLSLLFNPSVHLETAMSSSHSSFC